MELQHVIKRFPPETDVESQNNIVDPDYTGDGLYNWRGNPWLGVHPRPIEDDDYICGEVYCVD